MKDPKKISLRTINDLVEFNEALVNKQHNGQIDAKTADAINTTVKGQKALLVDLPLSVLKIAVQAQIKKMRLDPEIFTRLGLQNPVVALPTE